MTYQYLYKQPEPPSNNRIIISGFIVIFVIFVLFVLIKMNIISISFASSASSASSSSSPSQSSNSTNCIVSDWSDCVNSKRIKTITQATNGGIACTPSQNALPLTKICNDNGGLFPWCLDKQNSKSTQLSYPNEYLNKYPDLNFSNNTYIGSIEYTGVDDTRSYPDMIIHSIKSEGYDMILYSLPNYKGTKMELTGKIIIECLDKPMRSAIIAPSPNGGFPCTQLTKVCKDNGGLFPWCLDKQNSKSTQLSYPNEYLNKYPDLNFSNNTYIGSIEYTGVDDTRSYPDMIIHSIKSEGYDMILYSLPNYKGTKMELTGKIIIECLDKPMRSAIINTMYKKSII